MCRFGVFRIHVSHERTRRRNRQDKIREHLKRNIVVGERCAIRSISLSYFSCKFNVEFSSKKLTQQWHRNKECVLPTKRLPKILPFAEMCRNPRKRKKKVRQLDLGCWPFSFSSFVDQRYFK